MEMSATTRWIKGQLSSLLDENRSLKSKIIYLESRKAELEGAIEIAIKELESSYATDTKGIIADLKKALEDPEWR